jgi:serine/threonine-protein kinase
MPAEVTWLAVVLPDDAPLRFAGNHQDLAISPDGTKVIYVSPALGGAGSQLNLRPIDQLVGAPLRGGEGAVGPFVSPDSQWVGFQIGDTNLRKVSIFGGPPETVIEFRDSILGASWGTHDEIIFGTVDDELYRVSADGGEAEALTTLDAEQSEASHRWPSIVPGAEAVVFVITTDRPLTTGQLAVLDLSTGEVKRLGLAGTSPRYVSTGHLIYAADDGSVRGVPFDATSLEVTGSPMPLVEDVVVKNTGAANFGISDHGRLAYALGVGGRGAPRSLVWVDRRGREEPLGDAWPPDQYLYPRFSPDGTRVVLAVAENAEDTSTPSDLWVLDLARAGSRTRITFGGNPRFFPVWSPDGSQVAFADEGGRTANRLLLAPADGNGQIETLLDVDERQFPTSWARDGRVMAIYTDHAETARDLAVLPIVGDRTPVPFLATPFQERAPTFSPDARWLAYVSDESGQDQVYVRPYPGPGQRHTISTNGGKEPVWSRDGSELFYRNEDQVLVVAVDAAEAFGVPKQLFVGAYDLDISGAGMGGVPNYDIAPDGQRFLMVKREEMSGQHSVQINVVLNWFQELTERVPVP